MFKHNWLEKSILFSGVIVVCASEK